MILTNDIRNKNLQKTKNWNTQFRNGDGAVRNGACLEPRVIARAPEGQGW